MVQFEELLLKVQALKPEIDDLSDALGMKGMLSEIQQLELKATEPGFWDDVEKSQKVLQRTGTLKGKVEAYEALVAKYEDTCALIELRKRIFRFLKRLKARLRELKKVLKSKDFKLFLQANMIRTMQFLLSTQVRAVQRLRTGRKCFTECTTVGQMLTDLK